MTREDIFKLLNKHQDNDTLDIKTAKEMVNIIFDEHEAQLRAKDEEIVALKAECEYDQRNAARSQRESVSLLDKLKAKDDEIDRLKKLVNDFNNTYSVGDFDFESYYAMIKEN